MITAPGQPLCLLAGAIVTLSLAACSRNMYDQERADPMEVTTFFADGTTSRPRVPGTVARDEAVTTPQWPEISLQLLEVGRSRFDGICAACHGRDGYGMGIVVQRGFPAPPSLHEQRLRDGDDDHILRVIENGQGKMPAYSDVLDRRERFAVVAYLRALQLSQHADAQELPPDVLDNLQQQKHDPKELRH